MVHQSIQRKHRNFSKTFPWANSTRRFCLKGTFLSNVNSFSSHMLKEPRDIFQVAKLVESSNKFHVTGTKSKMHFAEQENLNAEFASLLWNCFYGLAFAYCFPFANVKINLQIIELKKRGQERRKGKPDFTFTFETLSALNQYNDDVVDVISLSGEKHIFHCWALFFWSC